MPIGSGLGSSACSVVAALVAMNEFLRQAAERDAHAGADGRDGRRISGSIHYDNVAPCYLGGMQLMIEENGIISQQVPGFDEWLWVLAYPGIKVSTALKRGRFCRRSIAARIVSPMVATSRAFYSRLLHPPAAAGGKIDERCDCRTVPNQTAAGL